MSTILINDETLTMMDDPHSTSTSRHDKLSEQPDSCSEKFNSIVLTFSAYELVSVQEIQILVQNSLNSWENTGIYQDRSLTSFGIRKNPETRILQHLKK